MLLTAVFAPLIALAVASLRNLGYLGEDDPDDEALYKALTVFIETENFEEREAGAGIPGSGGARVHEGEVVRRPQWPGCRRCCSLVRGRRRVLLGMER